MDADATPGDVQLISGAGSASVMLDLGTAQVAVRTPMALTAGSATTFTIANPGDTILMSLTTTAQPTFIGIGSNVGITDANASPFLATLPDGTWADAVGLPLISGSAATSFDFVLGDSTQEAGYMVQLAIEGTPINDQFAEGNDTTDGSTTTTTNVCSQAQLACEMTPATLSSADDTDIIKLTAVPKGAVIHVNTQIGPDALTDTAVDIQDAQGSSLTGGSVDGGTPGGDGGFTCALEGICGEDVFSAATAGSGNVFVVITAGAEFEAAGADDAYAAFVEQL